MFEFLVWVKIGTMKTTGKRAPRERKGSRPGRKATQGRGAQRTAHQRGRKIMGRKTESKNEKKKGSKKREEVLPQWNSSESRYRIPASAKTLGGKRIKRKR